MSLQERARKLVKKTNPYLWSQLSRWRGQRAQRRHWDARIADVLSCPDNAHLTRVPAAGKIVNGFQIMHNGLKVLADGYYGDGITRLLKANRGCHEPQEEVVFQEVLRRLPESAVMLELGAYWAFYSMWFSREVRSPQVFLVEQDRLSLDVGRTNFRANHCTGHFTHALVGATPATEPGGATTISVDSFALEHGLNNIEILHSDIQGFEVEMLRGAVHALESKRIRYLFISTHSEDLHSQCHSFLEERAYEIVVSISPAHSFSVDGILTARDPQFDNKPIIHPSRKLI